MGGNRPPRNLTIPEVKLIPLLMLQTDTTKVTKMMTPNQAVQMNLEALTDPGVQAAPVGLEVLEVPMVPEAPEVPADLATTPPMSKTSCENS